METVCKRLSTSWYISLHEPSVVLQDHHSHFHTNQLCDGVWVCVGVPVAIHLCSISACIKHVIDMSVLYTIITDTHFVVRKRRIDPERIPICMAE